MSYKPKQACSYGDLQTEIKYFGGVEFVKMDLHITTLLKAGTGGKPLLRTRSIDA
ncbi:MAG: hypothetical protein ACXWC9_11135 [Pseudobdellovibrionaceae bacterium]